MLYKNIQISILSILIIILLSGFSYCQDSIPEIDIRPLSINLYRFSRGVNNWLALIGPDGVLLSDSGPESYAKATKVNLKRLGSNDVKYIINTHWHHDHTGGNLLFGDGATIIAHKNVSSQLSTKQKITFFNESFDAYPAYACPNLLFSTRLKIYFNNEEIEIIHLPNGHTDGDVVVYFKNANVLHISDLYISGQFPAIDYEHGGNVEQLAKNLSWIIKNMPLDVTIISGHLQDASIEDLNDFQKMLISTNNIVKSEIQRGRTLEEMKNAHILAEWITWGMHVSCDMWIEIIYHCMTNGIEQD